MWNYGISRATFLPATVIFPSPSDWASKHWKAFQSFLHCYYVKVGIFVHVCGARIASLKHLNRLIWWRNQQLFVSVAINLFSRHVNLLHLNLVMHPTLVSAYCWQFFLHETLAAYFQCNLTVSSMSRTDIWPPSLLDLVVWLYAMWTCSVGQVGVSLWLACW